MNKDCGCRLEPSSKYPDPNCQLCFGTGKVVDWPTLLGQFDLSEGVELYNSTGSDETKTSWTASMSYAGSDMDSLSSGKQPSPPHALIKLALRLEEVGRCAVKKHEVTPTLKAVRYIASNWDVDLTYREKLQKAEQWVRDWIQGKNYSIGNVRLGDDAIRVYKGTQTGKSPRLMRIIRLPGYRKKKL